MSTLTVNITFAPIFNLSNLLNLPCLFAFDSELLASLPMGTYNYLEFLSSAPIV